MASSMSAPYTKQVQGQSEQFSNLEHVSKLQKQKERGIVYNQALEFISQHRGVGRFLALCPREQENKVPGIPGLQNKLLLEHNRALSLRMQSSHFQWLCKEVTDSKAGTEHTRTENLPRTKQTME